MTLSDEDIAAVLDAHGVCPVELDEFASLMGAIRQGDRVENIRAIARLWNVEPEDVLFSLFEAEPLFDKETWTNLTSDE